MGEETETCATHVLKVLESELMIIDNRVFYVRKKEKKRSRRRDLLDIREPYRENL